VVSCEFVTPLTSVTVGNWTVGGITFDTGAHGVIQPVLEVRNVNFEDIGSILTKKNLEVRINENARLESNVGLSDLKKSIKDMQRRIKDIDKERDGLSVDSTPLRIALGAEKGALLDNIKILERNLEDMPISVNSADIAASMSDAQQIRLAESAFIMHTKLGLVSRDVSMSITTIQNQLTVMQQREELGVVNHNQVDELTTKLMDIQTKLESTKLQQQSSERQLKDLLNDQDHSIEIGSMPSTSEDFIIKDEEADVKQAIENSYMIKLQKEQIVILQATLTRAEKDHGLSSDEYSRAKLQLSNTNLALSQQEDRVNSDYSNIIDDIAKKQSNLRLEQQKLKDKKVALSETQLKMSLGVITKLDLDSAITDFDLQGDTIKTDQIDLFSSINGYKWLLKGMPLTL